MRKAAPAIISVFAAIGAALGLGAPDAAACTAFILSAEDGAAVYGRTMEWGAFDLNSRLTVIPRQTEFRGKTPDGGNGMTWTGVHGAVALDTLGLDYFSDGINEKGLVVGLLWHAGFAEYADYDPERANATIGPADLGAFVLTGFADVEEVRAGLEGVRVVAVPEALLGGETPPLHLFVADRSGRAIVVEFTDGRARIFDNPERVLTNSPGFEWHLTNLRNYAHLRENPPADQKTGLLDVAPLGSGAGLLGMPGDFTPPSRFIRAAVLTRTARATPDGAETVYEALRILDSFNVPPRGGEGAEIAGNGAGPMRSSTIWSTVADTANLVYYYHTQHNRRLRMVDLNRIDFSPDPAGMRRFPLDRVKSQDIEDVTPPR